MKAKIYLTKQELQNLYLTKTNKEICESLEITMPTLLSALKKAGIELKGSGNRKSKSIIEIKND